MYTRHSSFADRLSKINVRYFAAIFNYLAQTYHQTIPEKLTHQIYRFDSTLIGLSAKLFSNGLTSGGTSDRRHFKISIGQKGLIPTSVYFCKNNAEISEDFALKHAIAEATISKNDIIVFDRGLQAGKTYINLTESELTFVTRIKLDRTYKILETYFLKDSGVSPGTILSDQKIILRNDKKERYFDTPFRLITVQNITGKEELRLLTNSLTLSAEEVAEVYRRRWEIEVFFKFIKQELNLKHFLARNINGLMVYIYTILIFSILLLIYKVKNSLSGFKFVKWDFFHELEAEIISDIVVICGGNPTIFLEKYGFS